jgi:hypothetical protein
MAALDPHAQTGTDEEHAIRAYAVMADTCEYYVRLMTPGHPDAAEFALAAQAFRSRARRLRALGGGGALHVLPPPSARRA